MTDKLKIGIIGAGVAGLAAAWDLVRAGHEVHLYEGEGNVGGLAAGFKDESWDWHLEKFYHHWFETDAHIKQIIDELGVTDQLLWPRPKTSYWLDGKLYRSEISPSALLLPLSADASETVSQEASSQTGLARWSPSARIIPSPVDLMVCSSRMTT